MIDQHYTHRMLCGKEIAIYGKHLIKDGAINQLIDCMIPDWTIRGAAMPDMHLGYTMPIGGVIETNGVVVPSWVGFDIGCGVCYVETDFSTTDLMTYRQEIYDILRARIPMGFSHSPQDRHDFPVHSMPSSMWFQDNYYNRGGNKQLGTLGSGNHFIEIGVNSNGKVCIVIHSGSRGIGHDTARHYIRMVHPNGKLGEGSYGLSITTKDGFDYLNDMNVCLEFALENRTVMLEDIEEAMQELGLNGGIQWSTLINNTHNHAEVKDGKVIHRKGATKSDDGVLGVIPGQSQAGSYIVRGRGVADSLCSSSHGAGRTGSRTEARLGKKDANGHRDPSTALSLEKFADDMDGIVAHVGPETLDEAPEAYKSPKLVMDAQKDLVEVVNHVAPVVCVKDISKAARPRKKTRMSLDPDPSLV